MIRNLLACSLAVRSGMEIRTWSYITQVILKIISVMEVESFVRSDGPKELRKLVKV